MYMDSTFIAPLSFYLSLSAHTHVLHIDTFKTELKKVKSKERFSYLDKTFSVSRNKTIS